MYITVNNLKKTASKMKEEEGVVEDETEKEKNENSNISMGITTQHYNITF